MGKAGVLAGARVDIEAPVALKAPQGPLGPLGLGFRV